MITSDDPLDHALKPPPNESLEQRTLRIAREEEAKRISLAIDASIKAERQARKKKRIVRLLLLGQSESGKAPLSIHFASPSVDNNLGKSTTLRREFSS
jgi:guanine nucleotide-binding protein subunit alpha